MTTERSKQRIPTILARLECAAVALSKTSSPDDAPPPAVSAEWYSQDVRFLLAELDAARAREQALTETFNERVNWIQVVEARWHAAEAREKKLREALDSLADAVEVHQSHAWATSDIDTASARAALAAGEDTHD